jgi:two-component system response regulator YesN
MMKLLIVDSELHVREAIRSAVNSGTYPIHHIEEASHGEEAVLWIEQQNPEIIMTDILMVTGDSSPLLPWIYEHAPHSIPIVMSAQKDFHLLRYTIHHSGRQYLTKPLDLISIGETVTKAIAYWEKNMAHHQLNARYPIEINQMRSVYWDKMLTKLIYEAAHSETVRHLLEQQFGLQTHTSKAHIAVFSIEHRRHVFLQPFAGDVELFFFAMMNICNECLLNSRSGVSFRNWHNELELILIIWEQHSEPQRLLTHIHRKLHQMYGYYADFGLGVSYAFPYLLRTSYQEATQSLKQRDVLNRTSWIHHWHPIYKNTALRSQFRTYGDRVKLAMRSGQRTRIEKVITEWQVEATRGMVITIGHIEQWWIEFKLLKMNWVQEFLPAWLEQQEHSSVFDESEQLHIPLDDRGMLCLLAWRESIITHLAYFSERLLAMQHQENKVIYDICKYMETNYHKHLTLQEMSNQFYMSREYISRKFKQEFNVNFSDYLTRIRIEKSKLLLVNPYLRIAQIAEQVGYPDEKYFSKVFKKMTGRSPKQYREQNK